METVYLRVKGIIKKGDKYLLIQRWVDDHIPNPCVWEFIDAEVNFAEAPDEAVLRAVREQLSVEGKIERIIYTWSSMIGDSQCVGIAYLCSLSEEEAENIVLPEEYTSCEWVERAAFPDYIENKFVLNDLEGVEL
jgi:8-oxo-dGTP pyrophosphatase MutT (NUDIX family)